MYQISGLNFDHGAAPGFHESIAKGFAEQFHGKIS
jgi:hypothetical protein